MKERLRGVLEHSDTILAIGVIGLVLLLVIPLPPLVLDVLLCLNLVLSVMALLLTFYVENALEFSAFPSLLLFLTLYRLGLNIASTRMILTRAEGGDIIRTFGNFVTEGHIGVGLILFALLTIINFVVVTKGAGRVAEVAARFTLEALGGKQMAIDSDLSAGMLTQDEAKEQRNRLAQEAEFYGSMDGASKFVRGDAIAGVIITCVNIVGGLGVGLLIKGFSLSQSWNLFTRLTVGDGLISQIPALLVSIGAGIIVTRASSESLGKAMTKQVFSHPKVFFITALLIFFLSFVPGMPLLIMLPISFSLAGYGAILLQGGKKEKESEERGRLIELQLGVKLIDKADELKEGLSKVRAAVEQNLGVTVPPIQITDKASLRPNTYAVLIQGEVACIERAPEMEHFLLRLEKVISKNAFELVGRTDIAKMVERIKRYDKTLVDELKLTVGQLLQVLQNLLKEEVSIRDKTTIIELITQSGESDLDKVTQIVREGLSRKISKQFFGKRKVAHVITIDPKVEQMLIASLTFSSQERLRPQTVEKMTEELKQISEKVLKEGVDPVVLTDGKSRLRLKKLIEAKLPDLPVLAYGEVSGDVSVETIGTIKTDVLL
ncbi:MAG: Flagellar biosynthesis protein FlhA [Chlamydiales bacterium]|nr:Flagellar biosynthesis protein FlhA [Chlamydiales bacterium]MCH9620230.1 Flagellar biosynthesis protein FlhA [Chlamydiales bacterium]MCH9623055.1 Flagellar biosynthesis protein FlhA [Chlamydiales bacterium]